MKIKSLGELQDYLEKDLVWRKKELIQIKLLAQLTRNSLYYRIGLVMLSAHFEGFIRTVARYYVVYVACQGFPLNKLRTNFNAIFFSKILVQDRESTKITCYTRKLNQILTQYPSTIFDVTYKQASSVIKTNSNPTSEVFEEIVASIGLSFEPYETKKKFINADLLKNRHAVAHGEPTKLEWHDFNETYKVIMEIMDCFSAQILEAAMKERHLLE